MVETRTKERSHGETDDKKPNTQKREGGTEATLFVVTHQNLRRVQQERVP
jgi:hypothetical protein